MRLMIILAAALMILAASGAQAQATDPYQWVGFTTTTFDGSGNGFGFTSMTTQCRADFGPGARMCKSSEYMDSDTLNPSGIPADGAWLRPSWRGFSEGRALDESGVARALPDLACEGWNNTAPEGLILTPNGSFGHESCATARPVTCCAPVPIPEPAASLSLPIGAMGLAGLSMLKGGS